MLVFAFEILALSAGVVVLLAAVAVLPFWRAELRRRSELAQAEHQLRVGALRAAESRQLDR